MRSFWSKKTPVILFITILVFTLIVLFFLVFDKTSTGHNVLRAEGADAEIHFLIYIATLALAVIAFIEFERAHKINTNELLTFISNRWSSKEIIKARQIIHEIFVYKYRYDKTSNPYSDFLIAMRNTSLDIHEMSKKISTEGEKFVYLLNLLDHFENISYLSKKHPIDLEDINNIYGNNIIFYYEIFEKYIQQRQIHHPNDFLNFTKVYSQLKESKKTPQKI